MYLVSKESIGNCRSSSDFNENLMKIRTKKHFGRVLLVAEFTRGRDIPVAEITRGRLLPMGDFSPWPS